MNGGRQSSCGEFRALYLAGEREQRAEAHLRGCAQCRRSLGDLDRMRHALADPGLWESPAADLRERVVRSIAEQARPAEAGQRRGRSWWHAAAAAAVIVLSAAGALLVTRGGDDPDWSLPLVAVVAPSGASVSVDGWSEREGTRMRLEVEGLDPSGPDAYYAIWLSSADGRHIPAGTFRESGMITAWAGVSRAEFPRVWITLEPNDDHEALTGVTVFDSPGGYASAPG